MSSCLFFMHFKSKYYISLHVIFMPLQSTLSRLVSDSPLETYCRKPTASKSRTLKKHSEVEIKTFKRDFEITGSIKTALSFQEKQTSLTLASFFPSQTHWRSFCSFYFCSLTSLTAVDLTIHSVFFIWLLHQYSRFHTPDWMIPFPISAVFRSEGLLIQQKSLSLLGAT